MTEYLFGPLMEHNGGACPVDDDTDVRAILSGIKGWIDPLPAACLNWQGSDAVVLVYQVAQLKPDPVVGKRVYYINPRQSLFKFPHEDCTKIAIMPTLDGDLASCKCGQFRVEKR